MTLAVARGTIAGPRVVGCAVRRLGGILRLGGLLVLLAVPPATAQLVPMPPGIIAALPTPPDTVAGPVAAVQAADDARAVVSTQTPLSPFWQFVWDWFGVSARDLQIRALRVVFILLVVALARLCVFVVQHVSRLMVYSEWGPLRLLFRNHQRSITLQSLLISLTKYVVYIIALGYVLREIGVDYTAYLASLSLIGIAIGFGSQGLVQDVVTGFFILFEDQFSVGDMVEVSGQVGVVESIGLRTTRIRNYVGASVVLQNRNIPMAVRYPVGGMEALIDIAVADAVAGERAVPLAQQVTAELERQFREVLLGDSATDGLVQLATGEVFVRLRLRFWPAQQWVIEAQVVPRLREAFARAELTIPGDRIVCFYHAPAAPLVVPSFMHALRGYAGLQARSRPGKD